MTKRGSVAQAAAIAAALTAAVIGRAAPAAEVQHRCVIPHDLARFDHPLLRFQHRIAAGLPVKIVAIGSSSTAGTGASSSAATYPSRLAVELKRLIPGAPVTVLNRGVGGEEARDMLARLDTSVFQERPDFVIWQVGTNAVLKDHPLPPAAKQIDQGIRQIRAHHLDLVLMDPQFAPKVIAKPETPGMVDLLARTAKEYKIDLFHRFALMRRWREEEGIPFADFLSRDQLHMNDWSYACVAKALAAAVADAATRPVAAASVRVPARSAIPVP